VIVSFAGKFTISECVPKFNSFISSCRNDLSVIRWESYGKNFFSVSKELSYNL